MKTIDDKSIVLDLTSAIPYLDALDLAESFPSLFLSCQDRPDDLEREKLMDDAMSIIDEYCPHLWPYIDRAILSCIT